MNLVKWFRKNNAKLMAVVVILLMLAFVMDDFLRLLGQSSAWSKSRTVAGWGDNKTITTDNIAMARQELETLRQIGADALLRSQSLQTVVLCEILFPERRSSAEIHRQIKQVIRTNNLKISDKQLYEIYNQRAAGSDILWLLLKHEAEQAGFNMSELQARLTLTNVAPQLAEGYTYAKMIEQVSNLQGIAEKDILQTFAELMNIVEYARAVCASENGTIAQTMHQASIENETINAELVKFDTALFAKAQPEPTDQEITGHFEKCKTFAPGQITADNPYGFGYKLPDRVEIEYLAVKLGDVAGIVTVPSQEEIEEYYQKHLKQFTSSVLSDPNDPNSPMTEKVKSYAEAAGIISTALTKDRINTTADKILQDAKSVIEAGLEKTDIPVKDLTSQQLKGLVGDYKTAGDELSTKYGIKIYTGRTGILSANDIRSDQYLSRMYMTGYGNNTVGLTQILFSVSELGITELGPFDVAKPRMYENIGPIKDSSSQTSSQIMMIARVVNAEKAAAPADINYTCSKNALTAIDGKPDAGYSVRNKVVEDFKKLAAIETTKKNANDFMALAVKDGWEKAVDKFNSLYGKQETDPNVFKIQTIARLERTPRQLPEILAVQNENDPAARSFINEMEKQARFTDQLYSLVPADKETVDTVPVVIESKQNASFYVVKSVSVTRLLQESYEKNKSAQIYKNDIMQSQSLAVVHFKPENILKRMNYKPLLEQNPEAEAPAKSQGT